MSTSARPPEQDPLTVEPEYGAPTTLLVYATVALGLAIGLGSLLFAQQDFDLATAVLSLLVVAPFLIYARLAVARPGAEAVIGGVVLLALGTWGSIDAASEGDSGAFLRLSLILVVLQLAIFVAGAALRAVIPPREVASEDEDHLG